MSLFPGLPHFGRYRLIAADPPWAHENFGQAKHGAAKSNYDEMPLEDLERMPVGELAHPAGALLLLWCTGPQAADGAHRRLAEAWGFRLTTRAFAWVKTLGGCAGCGHKIEEHSPTSVHGPTAAGRCHAPYVYRGRDPGQTDRVAECPCLAFSAAADFGPGSYTGGNVEDVWLGVRGDGTAWSKLRARRDIRQVIFAPAALMHSKKPEAMQDRVEALWPHVDPSERLELFARRRRPGWSCWGGQCPEPDLVFGDAVGAWWPLSAPAAAVAAVPQASLFGEGS